MKKLFLLLLLVAAGLRAQTVLDLGARGELTLYFPSGWTINTTDMAGQMTLTAAPEGDANASCNLMITFPDQDRFDTKQRLKIRVEADALPIAQGSVEGKAVAREFALTTGYGFYCNFTDAELRGQKPQKGNYKVMTVGKIRVSPEVMIDVQIMADGFREQPYQELLGAIEGMEYKATGGGSRRRR